MAERPLLKIADIAARLNCSEVHARRIAREIGVVKVGRLVRVRPADLDRYIAAGGSCYDPIKRKQRSASTTPTTPPTKDAAYFAQLREKYGKRKKGAPATRSVLSPIRSRLRVPVRR